MEDIKVVSEQADKDLADRILSQQAPLPPEIDSVSMEFRNDSSGDPAIFLSFRIREDSRLDKEAIARLSQYLTSVSLELLQKGISRFPYVSLDEAA